MNLFELWYYIRGLHDSVSSILGSVTIEIRTQVRVLEYAYSQAPKNMNFIMSFFIIITATKADLRQVLVPLSVDPRLV